MKSFISFQNYVLLSSRGEETHLDLEKKLFCKHKCLNLILKIYKKKIQNIYFPLTASIQVFECFHAIVNKRSVLFVSKSTWAWKWIVIGYDFHYYLCAIFT